MDWSQLTWHSPHLWWVAVLAGLAYALALAGLGMWRRRVRARLGDAPLVARLVATVHPGRQALKAVMATLGMVLVLTALLRPQYGLRETEIAHTGIDIAVVLDASQSMLVRDVAPDRFAAAKREVATLLDKLKGGRVSLIPFYVLPFVQTPLTSDFEAVKIYLRDLDLEDLAEPEMRGTSIGRALAAAVGVLSAEARQALAARGDTDAAEAPDTAAAPAQGSKYKAILLFTDGEEQESIPEDLIQFAKDAEIRIFAVGVGTANGHAVPTLGPDGDVTGVLKDGEGQPVFSSLNEELLNRMAEATGGEVFLFSNRSVVPDLVRAIEALERKEFEARVATLGEDRYQFLLVPALLLLLGEAFLGDRRRLRRKNGPAPAPAAV